MRHPNGADGGTMRLLDHQRWLACAVAFILVLSAPIDAVDPTVTTTGTSTVTTAITSKIACDTESGYLIVNVSSVNKHALLGLLSASYASVSYLNSTAPKRFSRFGYGKREKEDWLSQISLYF